MNEIILIFLKKFRFINLFFSWTAILCTAYLCNQIYSPKLKFVFLLVAKNTNVETIERIASHRQSLGQCRIWLLKNYPNAELIECSSNAQAAQLAATTNNTAAIAGETAAGIYNLVSLTRHIRVK